MPKTLQLIWLSYFSVFNRNIYILNFSFSIVSIELKNNNNNNWQVCLDETLPFQFLFFPPTFSLYGLFILESGLEFWPIYQLGQGRRANQLIKTSLLYVGYITCCLFTSRPTFAYRPLDCKTESKETTLSYTSLGCRIIKW